MIIEHLGFLIFSSHYFVGLLILAILLLSVTIGVIGINYNVEKNFRVVCVLQLK
jgi:hypothetical protein